MNSLLFFLSFVCPIDLFLDHISGPSSDLLLLSDDQPMGDQHASAKVSRSFNQSEEDLDLRRGPWTVEEDFALINYIAHHGDGRWNSLARCAGLKRTGKSCRLRWLNYLRPEVRRGNITLEEQLTILELHSQWGNRWSKIAQYLPGRTDNEIKNYWRTRVQKHAKQLKCDVNSKQFKDTMRYLWIPRLVERIQSAAASGGGAVEAGTAVSSSSTRAADHPLNYLDNDNLDMLVPPPNSRAVGLPQTPSAAASSDSFGTQVSPLSDHCNEGWNQDYCFANLLSYGDQNLTSPNNYFNQGLDLHGPDESNHWMDGGDAPESFWNVDDLWLIRQHLNSNV